MNEINGAGIAVIPLMTLSAAGTAKAGSWDTKGYDSCNIFIMGYNGSAASSGVLSSIILSEHDTTTSATSQTDIVAFTGGTATSTSVGFVIGGDTTNTGQTGVIELQVNLKKRKRYIGLYIVADQGATNYAGGVAVFGRPGVSKDTAALKAITNLEATMASEVTLAIG